MSDTHLWGIFVDWAQENGWHEWEGELNVTPHWCRHWFTTTLRNEIDQDEVKVGTVKGYVKGLRGDSDNDTIDLYTHDWDDEYWMREVYVENIPSLYVELPEDHYTTTPP
jgi:integrase